MSPHREDAAHYEIRIQGHLDPRRLEPFEETKIAHLADGETRIVSLLKDQAALHGLLNHLFNLGVTLLSVQRLADVEENKEPPPQPSPAHLAGEGEKRARPRDAPSPPPCGLYSED